MSEPELEDISDYDTLKGEKKSVVWTVIIVGLLIGTAFLIINAKYGAVKDGIQINDPIKNVKLAK